MTRYRAALSCALLVLAVTLACGGKGRPPAVTTGPGSVRSTPGTPTRTPIEPVGPGPDVQPVGGEEATGRDIPPDTGGEGGPLADIHYDYDKATLSDEARAILEKHALWLQNRREVKVRIEGHCDERGTVEYNLALGEQRAQTARDYLASLGVAADRLSTVSYGKERPADPGRGEQAWAKNRRAHFAVAP